MRASSRAHCIFLLVSAITSSPLALPPLAQFTSLIGDILSAADECLGTVGEWSMGGCVYHSVELVLYNTVCGKVIQCIYLYNVV